MTRAIRSDIPKECADLEMEMLQDTESLQESDFGSDVDGIMEVCWTLVSHWSLFFLDSGS